MFIHQGAQHIWSSQIRHPVTASISELDLNHWFPSGDAFSSIRFAPNNYPQLISPHEVRKSQRDTYEKHDL